MIGTQKDLTKIEKTHDQIILNVLGMASNSLYNSGVYTVRQEYFKSRNFVGYSRLCSDFKADENYKVMHSQAGQQTLKSVTFAFNSYRELEALSRAGEISQKPRLPGYRKPGGMYQVVYPGQALKVVEQQGAKWLEVPLGRAGKTYFEGITCFLVTYPQRLQDKQIKELRFIPQHGTWYVEYVYELPPVVQAVGNNAVGIDPGLNNLISIVCTNNKSLVVSGKRLKSINQWFNKTMAGLQRAASKQFGEDAFFTKRMARLTDRRNRQMRDAINKVARQIIDWCLFQGVHTVVFGGNKGQKQDINLGKRTNQNFVQIPIARLRKRIEQLCELHGIRYVETEESYTSQASFLDQDFLPTFGEKPEGWKGSGTRKRGMFKTNSGICLNADLNGAANILRKVSTRLGLDLSRMDRGCLTQPMRLYA